ncbi:MAG TPA: hypothetical protein PLZ86_08715 [bacterium]|mgnify:CR=1 FL=1|nr:hypothetical protein [bacterium]
MDARRRPGWEWALFIGVVVLAIALVGTTYAFQKHSAKQHALHYQLQLLRTAELLYLAVNSKLPERLEDVAQGSFRLPGDETTRRYLEHPPMMVGGKLTDPFGNTFTYDPTTGWIKSSTPGYEFW